MEQGQRIFIIALGALVEGVVFVSTAKAAMEIRMRFTDVSCGGANDRGGRLFLPANNPYQSSYGDICCVKAMSSS